MASVGVEPQAAAQPRLGFLFKDSALRTALFGLLLAVVTIAVYSPVHEHPFANIDDPKYVTQNPHIANGLSGGAVFWAFTHCLLYTSPSPRDRQKSRMPSSA